jgi:hypothetical protein
MDSLLTYLEKNHTVNHRVLLPINFVPIVHYYHPSLDIFAFIYGSSDEQIVRKVNECNCDGLLYVGTSDQKIDKLIQSVGPFRKDILAAVEGKVAFTFFRRVPQAVN